jgi:sulfate permease, SulP family
MVGQLVGPAAGVALMAFVESIAAARAFTARDEPEVDADQELRALGAANLAAGCFQAFPAGGGLSQTAVNRESGARSQLAGMVTALVVVLTLLFLTPLFENLPQATLGAVVIVAVVGLVDLAALGGVLVLGVLGGVLLAVLVSMLTLMHGVNHPPSRCWGADPAPATGGPLTGIPTARPSLGCWPCGPWPRSTSPTGPGSGAAARPGRRRRPTPQGAGPGPRRRPRHRRHRPG